MDQRADKKLRVTRRKDVSRLFEQGRRVSDGLITLFGLPRDTQTAPVRAGIAVSKRCGNPVRRNRIKRLSREAFRLTRSELPTGWDFMIVPRPGADMTLADLQVSVRNLAGRLTQGPPKTETCE